MSVSYLTFGFTGVFGRTQSNYMMCKNTENVVN